MEKIQNILGQVNSIIKNYEKIAKVTGENFNIFTVMGMESNEVKTHSAIIGELLNPQGTHGLEDIPLKLFIEQIKSGLDISDISDFTNKFDLDTKTSRSIVEEYAGRIDEGKTVGGRIDIVIKDENGKAIIIENKIYAGEQVNQLLRYNDRYPNSPILFLTLFGDASKSSANSELNKKLILNSDYFLVSYEKDIVEWLGKCLKEAVNFPMLREVIQQYIYLIKKLTNQTTNNKMSEEIRELIYKNIDDTKQLVKEYKKIENELDNRINEIGRKLEFQKDTFHLSDNTKIKTEGPFNYLGNRIYKYSIFNEWNYSNVIWVEIKRVDLQIVLNTYFQKSCDADFSSHPISDNLHKDFTIKEIKINEELVNIFEEEVNNVLKIFLLQK